MKLQMTAFMFFAGLVFAPVSAFAVTLGLQTGAPTLSAGAAVIDYIEFAPDGDLSTVAAEVDDTSGVSPDGFTTIDFGVGFSLADPTDSADPAFAGFLDVIDDAGQFLAGDLLAIGFTEDVIELQFDNLSGTGAGAFGTSVLVLVTFDDPLGANPFGDLFDGDALGASISIARVQPVTPIPLPAALPLLGAGLGVLVILRLRRTASSRFLSA